MPFGRCGKFTLDLDSNCCPCPRRFRRSHGARLSRDPPARHADELATARAAVAGVCAPNKTAKLKKKHRSFLVLRWGVVRLDSARHRPRCASSIKSVRATNLVCSGVRVRKEGDRVCSTNGGRATWRTKL